MHKCGSSQQQHHAGIFASKGDLEAHPSTFRERVSERERVGGREGGVNRRSTTMIMIIVKNEKKHMGTETNVFLTIRKIS